MLFWIQNYLIHSLQIRSCSPAENECYQKLGHNTFDCRVSCTGLFADVNVKKTRQISRENLDNFNIENYEERQKLDLLLAQYGKYKTGFFENIYFENYYGVYSGYSRFNYSKL